MIANGEMTKCYCNQCGNIIDLKEEDCLSVNKVWGFFSNNKDRYIDSFYICETCYDEWVAQFCIEIHREEQREL